MTPQRPSGATLLHACAVRPDLAGRISNSADILYPEDQQGLHLEAQLDYSRRLLR